MHSVFAINEGKRSSLEQKALREAFMSGEGGLGGMGLGDMMSALTGKGGDAGDMAAMEEMMQVRYYI